MTTATATRRYSPSSLRVFESNCPAALDMYEAGEPIDRDGFATGTVAHACLEEISKATHAGGFELHENQVKATADRVMRHLLTEGREFHGHREPPPPPGAAIEGRDLAIEWAKWHPFQPGSFAELEGAFDSAWQPVDWRDPSARFRLVLDHADTVDATDEEGGSGNLLVIRDYKSAWGAGEKSLDTLQMRAQVVAAMLIVEHKAGGSEAVEYAGIRVEIGNLRTRKIHGRDLYPWTNEEHRALIIGWRDDLSAVMDAADRNAGDRPFRPGAGCLGCAYVSRCSAAQAFASATGEPMTAEEIARQFMVAQAQRDALFPRVKAVADKGSIPCDGKLVGYVGVTGREPIPEAGALLLDAWLTFGGMDPSADEVSVGAVHGLLRVLGIGISQAEKVAAAIHKPGSEPDWKDARQNLVAAVSTPAVRPSFGVHSGGGPGEI